MKRYLFWLLGVLTLLIGGGRILPLAQARRAVSGHASGYAVIRTYHVQPGGTAEVVRRARTGFLPLISRTPGFEAWYLLDAGSDTLVAVSVFKNQAGAEESTRRAAQWVKANLAELLPSPPAVTSGAVVVQKVK